MKDKMKKYSAELIILVIVIIVLFLPLELFLEEKEKIEIDIYDLKNIEVNEYAKSYSVIKEELPNFNNPVIPTGFKAINTKAANWDNMEWNNGLVIQDKDGNEFVWVPVDNINVKYEKRLKNINEDNTYESTLNDKNICKISEEERYKSVYKYGGFYIARYEAGVDELNYKNDFDYEKRDLKPLFKKGNIPINNINLFEATKLTYEMYEEEDITAFIVSGIMWDTVVNWVENTGTDINNNYSFGNYYKDDKSSMCKTGEYEEYKFKNIYDLAGNLWEITLESTNYKSAFIKPEYNNDDINIYSNFISIRGGSYLDYNKNTSISSSNKFVDVFGFPYVGFRVALYLN